MVTKNNELSYEISAIEENLKDWRFAYEDFCKTWEYEKSIHEEQQKTYEKMIRQNEVLLEKLKMELAEEEEKNNSIIKNSNSDSAKFINEYVKEFGVSDLLNSIVWLFAKMRYKGDFVYEGTTDEFVEYVLNELVDENEYPTIVQLLIFA